MRGKEWIDFLEHSAKITLKNIFRNSNSIPDLEYIYVEKFTIMEYSIDIYFYLPMPLTPIPKMIHKGCNILTGNFSISELENFQVSKKNFLHNSFEIYSINIIEKNKKLLLEMCSNYGTKISITFNGPFISLLNFGCSVVTDSFLNQLPSVYRKFQSAKLNF